MPKVKIDKLLYNKAKQVAENAGYSSVEEYVSHLLERAVEVAEAQDTDEEIAKRLQGLGYIS